MFISNIIWQVREESKLLQRLLKADDEIGTLICSLIEREERAAKWTQLTSFRKKSTNKSELLTLWLANMII